MGKGKKSASVGSGGVVRLALEVHGTAGLLPTGKEGGLGWAACW